MPRERLTKRFAAAADGKKKKSQSKGDMQRNTAGFEYDKSKAKHLKRALHNINVSLGTLLAAMKDLALLRGSDITPDGLLGGRGFIMNYREMKSHLNEAIGNLSDVTDTLADELNNPKWGLSKSEMHAVKKEKEEVLDKVDDAEDVGESIETGKPTEEAEVVEEDAVEAAPDPQIDPEDVVYSAEMEAIDRYKKLLEGDTKDRTASVLSKNILANLSQGE
ncbi:MAG: hypothetical protein GF334_06330 [Candidatus Altiarchaeales archaeon]|nr:hypothetical protein [Candidatus Altiarchaeales archaeon]